MYNCTCNPGFIGDGLTCEGKYNIDAIGDEQLYLIIDLVLSP